MNVLPLALPPLRERREDITALAECLLRRHGECASTNVKGFSDSAVQAMISYDWPGNIRELENVIERALTMSHGEFIDAQSLDLPVTHAVFSGGQSFKAQKNTVIAEFERRFLREVMSKNGGNITKSAISAGKDRRTFFELLKKHHLLNSQDHPQDIRRA